MDYPSDDDGGAIAVMNGRSPKPGRSVKKPDIHLDPVHGTFILDEAVTALERLQEEEAQAQGAEHRRIANRRWLWSKFVEQLESYHDGIQSGGA